MIASTLVIQSTWIKRSYTLVIWAHLFVNSLSRTVSSQCNVRIEPIFDFPIYTIHYFIHRQAIKGNFKIGKFMTSWRLAQPTNGDLSSPPVWPGVLVVVEWSWSCELTTTLDLSFFSLIERSDVMIFVNHKSPVVSALTWCPLLTKTRTQRFLQLSLTTYEHTHPCSPRVSRGIHTRSRSRNILPDVLCYRSTLI